MIENINTNQITGNLYVKSTQSTIWDRLVFVGEEQSEDEITLFTNNDHLFSGKYKIFLAFGQMSVIYISSQLDFKFDFTVKKAPHTFQLPPADQINDTFTATRVSNHCYLCQCCAKPDSTDTPNTEHQTPYNK